MDKGLLSQVIARELERAEEWDNQEWAPARLLGLQFYDGTLPVKPEDEDLSGAVSMDVADMTEAVLAQMQPAFTGAPPVEFEAEGSDDETPAAQESFIVHRQLSRNGQDFIAVSAGLRDAMLARAAIFKVWTDERDTVETLTFDDVPAGDLGMLLQVPEGKNEKRALVGALEDLKLEDGVYPAVKVKVSTKHRELKLEAVAPENFRFWANWRKPTLAGCPFQAERRRFIRGELAGLGIDDAMIEAIPRAMPVDDATALQRQADQSGTNTVDRDLEEVELWDVHIAVDWDDNGRAELTQCWYADTATGANAKRTGTVSDPEVCEFTPYGSGQIILQAHRFLGLSLGDRIGPTQTAKTEVLRQWLDNLAYMNNGRLVVAQGGADIKAVEENNKPGGVIPSLMPGGVTAIIGPDAGVSALSAMNYLDKARSEAGGASLDMQTAGGGGVQGQTWGGIERQYGAKELLAGLMLRTFAETGLREVYLLAHRNLRRYPPGKVNEKIHGEWVESDPASWRPRTLATVAAGVAGSQMNQRAASMRETISMQLKALEVGKGGELTDMAQVYSAILALERAKGVESPERFWINPQSQAAVKVRTDKAASAKQQTMEQAAFIERIAALQAALGAWEKRLDASVKYFSKVVDAEIETMKQLGASTAQLEALQTQGLVAAAGAVPKESPAEQVAREMGGAGGGAAVQPAPAAVQ